MSKIIERWASSDIDAFKIAQGMENAGATVFSITHNGMRLQNFAKVESSKFIVWGKYDYPITTGIIDEHVSAMYEDE